MADRGNNSSSHKALLKIADALGLSPESFYRDGSKTALPDSLKEEENELLGLFRMIDSHRDRQTCLDFMRTMAQSSQAETSTPSGKL